MKKVLHFLASRLLISSSFFFSILLVLSLLNASADSILVSNYTENGVVRTDLYYGSSEWSKMNNALANGNTISMVSNLENLSLMLQYDSIFVQMRSVYPGGSNSDFSGSLTNTELSNIRSFIENGGRVLMTGEWGGWPYGSEIGWQKWDNQILSIVDGTYATAYGDSPVAINPTSITNVNLTKNVGELSLLGNRYGTANGGTALFYPNVASVWGTNENVLTVLDTGVFSDYFWNNGLMHNLQ